MPIDDKSDNKNTSYWNIDVFYSCYFSQSSANQSDCLSNWSVYWSIL